MITKLEQSTVQRISSGQLILDVPSTMKELIENAIDAKATQVSISLEDDGLTSITVLSYPSRSHQTRLKCRDNGTGIPVDDREQLGQRHATSKIFAFEDILSVRTYGFRGEAISSLCVIGNLTATTRVEEEVTAQTLEFDHNGNIITYSPVFIGRLIVIGGGVQRDNEGRRLSFAISLMPSL